MDSQKPVAKHNDTQPLVSVGIPTFNRPQGLHRALQCIREQTYKNTQIIVSDNCTPGEEINNQMRAAVLDDVRIQYFRQTRNIGATANFEFVLEKSNGKYFFWMADDDLCDKYFVEKIVSALEQDSNLVLCGCDVTVIDESDQFLESIKLDSIRPNGNWLLTRKLFFCYPTSNIFFCIYGIARTEILKKCGGLYKFAWKGLATNSEVTFLARLSRAGKIAVLMTISA